MEQKKIAFITNCMYSGGAERVISILSNSLSANYEVFIIILVDSPSFYTLNSSVTLLHCKHTSNQRKIFLMHYNQILNYINLY